MQEEAVQSLTDRSQGRVVAAAQAQMGDLWTQGSDLEVSTQDGKDALRACGPATSAARSWPPHAQWAERRGG